MQSDDQSGATVGASANDFQYEAGLPVGRQPPSFQDVARVGGRVPAVSCLAPGHILPAVARG